MKKYEAPELFVDTFAADTMIASINTPKSGGGPKNDNAGNNQNCWGFNCVPGAVEDGQDACLGNGISMGC